MNDFSRRVEESTKRVVQSMFSYCKLLTTSCVGKCIIFLVPITSSQYDMPAGPRSEREAACKQEGRGEKGRCWWGWVDRTVFTDKWLIHIIGFQVTKQASRALQYRQYFSQLVWLSMTTEVSFINLYHFTLAVLNPDIYMNELLSDFHLSLLTSCFLMSIKLVDTSPGLVWLCQTVLPCYF